MISPNGSAILPRRVRWAASELTVHASIEESVVNADDISAPYSVREELLLGGSIFFMKLDSSLAVRRGQLSTYRIGDIDTIQTTGGSFQLQLPVLRQAAAVESI